ncbi:LacI family DNA-binding transcriptional regulator [Kutzneria sp. 744]|uniref:LacI family DNA-binding transcriptional regulator n=1 Tax=Kutzneria sp. (strain 744) TaxID=345341 RepID=UPI0003EEB6C1|nr:transcriptional regulator, LacI family [Kutzneria sp. 744]
MVVQRPNARPTLEDVAARAGVSRATASRVLNGSPKVSPAALESVNSAVLELGYQPNQAARTLVTRRTGAVAVLISEPQPKIFNDPHFAGLVKYSAVALGARDSQMVLVLVHTPEDQLRAQRFLAGGHVDGALLFTPHQDDPLPILVRKLALPVVFGGRPWGSLRGLHTVDNDNENGAAMATRYLGERGCRQVVSITGPNDELAATDRLAGFRAATGADDRRLAEITEGGSFSREGGERAMTALLARVPDLDGVFAANDLMAAGAMAALRAAGKRVPQDVAVVGFDDDESVAPHTEPPLTSVRQDIGRQVQAMVDRLFSLIRGEEPRQRHQLLPVELVHRNSA